MVKVVFVVKGWDITSGPNHVCISLLWLITYWELVKDSGLCKTPPDGEVITCTNLSHSSIQRPTSM